MISQELVEAHSGRILRASLAFEQKVSEEIDGVVASVSSFVVHSLKTQEGVVVQSPENAKRILDVDSVFKQALDTSEYYPNLLAFVGGFVDQVDEFMDLYEEMRRDVRQSHGAFLPQVMFTDEDRELLSHQAAAAVVMLDGHSTQTLHELRQLLVRSLGESNIAELIKGISESIRKMTKVGPMAKDQLIVFFRSIGSLAYRRIESSGRILKYSYVGPQDKKVRGFCASLLGGSKFTRNEISAMDNGQVHGVFDNCGGYGCRHWWAVSEVLL